MRYATLYFLLLLTGASLLAMPARADVQLKISGADADLVANVTHHVGAVTDAEINRPRQLRRRLRLAITTASEALGYYDTHFTLQLDNQTVNIQLDPGQPVLWLKPELRVEGAAQQVRAIQAKLASTPLTAGAVLNHGSYDRYKRELLDTCIEYGFLDARYQASQLEVDLSSHRAQATLILDCGQRYHFGSVTFSPSILKPDLLQRLSPIKPGTAFRKHRISELYRNLQDSRHFAEIDVETTPDPATHTVAVAVAVKDAPRHQFSIGIGYGTDTGPNARLRWDRPNINSAGHSLSVETSVSVPIQSLTADYRIPLQRPLEHYINIPTTWEHKVVEDTDSTIGRIGVFYNDTLFSNSFFGENWRASYGSSFEVESYQQGSAPRNTVNYLLPSTTLSETVLPEGIDPLTGHKTWVTVAGSGPALGADTAFLRFDAGYKRLFGLGGSHLVIGRAELGAITTEDVSLIPSSQRFFTGGDATVRGYDYESLATADANGKLIGGRFLNVASLEYSLRVLPTWRAAAFIDAGRAFSDIGEHWHKAVGIGARWLSPVGQIRVDLAFPINEPDRSWRLHIFMGPPL